MSNDSVSVTSSQSWFSRVGSAIAGVLVGIVLFLGSFVLLTWNEGRSIHRAKTLETGGKEVVSADPAKVDPAREGKLVHVTGDVAASGPAADELFDVSTPAIRLRRNVEVYQWVEDKKSETKQKLGGGEETVTTYTYSKKWSSGLVSSSDFNTPAGHENPSEMTADSETFAAPGIAVGAFKLPPDLVERIDNFAPLSLPADPAVPKFNVPVERATNGFYVGENPSTPAVGDLRVKFESAAPGPVSVIARQYRDTFEAYEIPRLGSIELLQVGTVSAEAMFQVEAQSNSILTWVLRLLGFAMMFGGLCLIAKPLSVVGSVIPFIGNILEAGAGIIAFAIALPLTLATIAVAWVAYRPIIGIPLLLAAGAAIFFAARMLPKRKSKTATA